MVRAAAAVPARPYKYTHERVGKFQVIRLRQLGLDSNFIILVSLAEIEAEFLLTLKLYPSMVTQNTTKQHVFYFLCITILLFLFRYLSRREIHVVILVVCWCCPVFSRRPFKQRLAEWPCSCSHPPTSCCASLDLPS